MYEMKLDDVRYGARARKIVDVLSLKDGMSMVILRGGVLYGVKCFKFLIEGMIEFMYKVFNF